MQPLRLRGLGRAAPRRALARRARASARASWRAPPRAPNGVPSPRRSTCRGRAAVHTPRMPDRPRRGAARSARRCAVPRSSRRACRAPARAVRPRARDSRSTGGRARAGTGSRRCRAFPRDTAWRGARRGGIPRAARRRARRARRGCERAARRRTHRRAAALRRSASRDAVEVSVEGRGAQQPSGVAGKDEVRRPVVPLRGEARRGGGRDRQRVHVAADPRRRCRRDALSRARAERSVARAAVFGPSTIVTRVFPS